MQAWNGLNKNTLEKHYLSTLEGSLQFELFSKKEQKKEEMVSREKEKNLPATKGKNSVKEPRRDHRTQHSHAHKQAPLLI